MDNVFLNKIKINQKHINTTFLNILSFSVKSFIIWLYKRNQITESCKKVASNQQGDFIVLLYITFFVIKWYLRRIKTFTKHFYVLVKVLMSIGPMNKYTNGLSCKYIFHYHQQPYNWYPYL